MKNTFIISLLFCSLAWAGGQAHYRMDRAGIVLPDPVETPGAARTRDSKAVCAETFRTADERHTTASMKTKVYRLYAVERNKGRCAGGCEVDHLISLELGGADEISNLWPEPSKGIGYHVKDKLENRLHRMVCAGKLSLPAAQKCIADDWYACGLRLGVFDARGNLLGQR